jgi:hypothetical protein
VNRSGIFVGKSSLKDLELYPQITQIFADFLNQEMRKQEQRFSCIPAFLIKSARGAVVVSAVPSGSGLGNDCAGDSARTTEDFFESGKSGNEDTGEKGLETRSAPALLGAAHRAFAFYLGNPLPRFLRSCFPY